MRTRPTQMLPLRQFEVPDSAAELVDGHRYRFDHLTLLMVMKDMRFVSTDPAPGEHVPTFDLPTIDGGRLRSSDLGGRPVLLIFGSSTCPVTDNAAPGLHELHRRFGDRVRFVIVNVREAHPGKAFPQPKTMVVRTRGLLVRDERRTLSDAGDAGLSRDAGRTVPQYPSERR